MAGLDREIDSVFIDVLHPRFYFGPLGHRDLEFEHEQTRSSLQTYIDEQPRVSEDELRALAARIQAGDLNAPAEIVDKSLKIIRQTAREINRKIWLDEDELIGMAVANVLSKARQLDPTSEETVGTRIRNLSRWGILRSLENYTRNVSVPGHIFQVMGHALRELYQEFGDNGEIAHAHGRPENSSSNEEENRTWRDLAITAIEMIRSQSLHVFAETNAQNPDPEQEIDLSDLSARIELNALIRVLDDEHLGFSRRGAYQRSKVMTFRRLGVGENLEEIAGSQNPKITPERARQIIKQYIVALKLAYAISHAMSAEETEEFVSEKVNLGQASRIKRPSETLSTED